MLSGGNQQRLVVARELDRNPDLLVAENPTRGLDILATAFVHVKLDQFRRSGASGPQGAQGADGSERRAVVLISTDLDEVLGLADRVVVMVRGRLVPVAPEETTREAVGRIMVAAGRDGP